MQERIKSLKLLGHNPGPLLGARARRRLAGC